MARSIEGKFCECGRPAVAYLSSCFTCQECLDADETDWTGLQGLRPLRRDTTTRFNNRARAREDAPFPHAYIRLASGATFGYNYSRWWEN